MTILILKERTFLEVGNKLEHYIMHSPVMAASILKMIEVIS